LIHTGEMRSKVSSAVINKNVWFQKRYINKEINWSICRW
jgi:hypothetical protein